MDAPLVFGGDMTQLDDFTLNILTNDEVIAVNQDALGKQAAPVDTGGSWKSGRNHSRTAQRRLAFLIAGMGSGSAVKWSDLSLHGQHKVRDLWRQKDLGTFDGEFHMNVGAHGAELIRIY